MSESNESGLSRRRSLGLVSAGALTAAVLAAQENRAGATDGTRTYNVRDFGAKGDGVTLDSAPVQAAIDACTRDHGGTVLVPAGVFVVGTVEMKSNVTLHIAAGGKLLGSDDGKQYHAADAIPLTGDSTLNDGNVGLIFAVGAENVTIEGPGTIDGQGKQFLSPGRGIDPPAGISGSHRPYHLLFQRCRNLTVRDIFLTQSAFHSVRIIQSSYVKLDGIHIYNRVNRNNDGFHFISSRYVHVTNCDVECQDDACALFGSCQFVTVTNCSFSTRWSVFRFGGGEAENITVSNCLIYDTYGCPVKMRCGPRSRFENISFSNLILKNVTGPFSIGLGPSPSRTAGQPPAVTPPGQPGIVRNITFSGIHCTVGRPIALADVPFISNYNPGEIKSCIALNGVDASLEKISFSDVTVTYPGGGTFEEGAVRDVPRVAGEYYETGVLPAWGLYARQVRGLDLRNVRFELAESDARPAVVFDHVSDAAINGLSVQGDRAAESVVRLIDSHDVLMTATRLLSPAKVFLQTEGTSINIIMDGGDLTKAAERSVALRG